MIEWISRHGRRAARARFAFVGLLAVFGPAITGAAAQESKAPAHGSKAAFDLAYVPTDATLVVAVRPVDLLKNNEIAARLEASREYLLVQRILRLNPRSIAQAIYVLDRDDRLPGTDDDDPVIPGLAILRASEAQDWDALAKVFGSNWTKEEYKGVTYRRLALAGGPTLSYYAPDDRTLIIGREANLFKAMTRGDGKSMDYAWTDAWKPMTGCDAAVVVDVGWVRDQGLADSVAELSDVSLLSAAFSPLWEESRFVALGLEMDGTLSLLTAATCATDAGATRYADTAQALLAICRNAIRSAPAMIQEAPPAAQDSLKKLTSHTETALVRARVERESKTIRLRLSTEIKLGELVHLIQEASGPIFESTKKIDGKVLD